MARIARSMLRRMDAAFFDALLDFVILSATNRLARASRLVKSKDPYWVPGLRAAALPASSRFLASLGMTTGVLRSRPKRLERLELRPIHFKYCQQFGHLKQITHALGQAGELDRSSRAARGCVQRY